MLFTVVGFRRLDVVTANVGSGPAQTRQAKAAEVQRIGCLPWTFVFAVKIRPVGVRQPDGVAAVADAALILVAAVVIAGAAAALLVGNFEGVNIPDVAGCQAPDAVAAPGIQRVRIFLLQARVIAVEVEYQFLIGRQRLGVVQAEVLLVQYIFHVGSVQRAAQLVVELVARAAEGDAFQAAVVAVVALTLLVGEVTGVHFQTGDLFWGQHGTGVGFIQQTGVVGIENWQRRALGTVAQHGVRETHFGGCAKLGEVGFGMTVVVLREEIDTARAAVTAAAVQAHAVLGDTVYAKADRALGKAGFKGGNKTLAPFAFIVQPIAIIAFDISVTQEQIQMAVVNKTLAIRLLASKRRCRGNNT